MFFHVQTISLQMEINGEVKWIWNEMKNSFKIVQKKKLPTNCFQNRKKNEILYKPFLKNWIDWAATLRKSISLNHRGSQVTTKRNSVKYSMTVHLQETKCLEKKCRYEDRYMECEVNKIDVISDLEKLTFWTGCSLNVYLGLG